MSWTLLPALLISIYNPLNVTFTVNLPCLLRRIKYLLLVPILLISCGSQWLMEFYSGATNSSSKVIQRLKLQCVFNRGDI